MLQKQNHKPISVTLAMRLDGTNLSPLGAIGSTPVSHKRPLSPRRRGSVLFADNGARPLTAHVTPPLPFGMCRHVVHIAGVGGAVGGVFSAFITKSPNCVGRRKHMSSLAVLRPTWQQSLVLKIEAVSGLCLHPSTHTSSSFGRQVGVQRAA